MRRRVLIFSGGGAHLKGVSLVRECLEPLDCEVTVLDHIPLELSVRSVDAMVICGGSGKWQSESMGRAGREAVKSFVKEGGGYLGICAGAYLATSTPWGLGLLPCEPWKHSLWDEGENLSGNILISRIHRSFVSAKAAQLSPVVAVLTISAGVKLALSNQYMELTCMVLLIVSTLAVIYIAAVPVSLQCNYKNGPLFDRGDLPRSVRVLSTVVEGVGSEHQKSEMQGKAVILSGVYGKGKVVLCSPHFEKDVLRHGHEVCTMLTMALAAADREGRSTALPVCFCRTCVPPSADTIEEENHLRRMIKDRVQFFKEQWMESNDNGELPTDDLRQQWVDMARADIIIDGRR